MSRNGIPPRPPFPPPAPIAAPRLHSAARWFGQVALAVTALVVGEFGGLVASLLAISCGDCQDGVRETRFNDLLELLVFRLMPLLGLATAFGSLHPRVGARLGAAGLGVLAALMLTVLVLGRI